MPRESVASSMPRPLDFVALALEHWVTRFRGWWQQAEKAVVAATDHQL